MLVPDPEMADGERVKILDFGVAKFLEGLPGLGSDHSSLTNADSRLGTPLFMSPEQCRNSSEVTDRADIYSLGVICYWLLSGVHPFKGATDMAIIMQHMTATATPLQELVPGTPRSVSELVDAMLAKTPGERPSARDVVNVLAPLLRGPLSYNTLPAVGSAQTTPPEASGQLARPALSTAAPAAPAAPAPAPSPAASPLAASPLAASPLAASPPPALPGAAIENEPLKIPLILPIAPPRVQRHARIDPDSTAKTQSVIGALGRAAVIARESASVSGKPAAPLSRAASSAPATAPARWARPAAIAAGVLVLLGLIWWLVLGRR